MIITKSKLKQVIKEELAKVFEADAVPPQPSAYIHKSQADFNTIKNNTANFLSTLYSLRLRNVNFVQDVVAKKKLAPITAEAVRKIVLMAESRSYFKDEMVINEKARQLYQFITESDSNMKAYSALNEEVMNLWGSR